MTRSFTSRQKPTADKVIEEMKSLEDSGLGHFISATANAKVYYKPLPTEENKTLIQQHASISDYMEVFTNQSMKDITVSQFNRLLALSPDETVLRDQYGYKDKE